jgi:hypothetical protein
MCQKKKRTREKIASPFISALDDDMIDQIDDDLEGTGPFPYVRYKAFVLPYTVMIE